MNVLYVSYDGALDPLGRSQVVLYLEGLSSEGFRYDLITFEKTARWNDLDDRRSMETRLSRANIRWHPLRYRRRPPVLGTLLNLLEGYRLALRLDGERAFDLVHARSYPSSVVARRLKTRRRIPFIFDMRGFYPEERVDGGLWKKGGVLFKAAKRVERDLFGMADGIVTLTEASLPILSTRIAAAGGRAVPRVIPTCVDLDRFKPVPTGTRPEEFTLAYFGSLGTWYRLGDMLRFGRYVLEAAGGGRLLFLTNDDPSPVQRLAAEAGMPPEVLSVGSVPHEDVPAALAGAHATFFLIRSGPSRFGFHQTKLGESLALGLPVADPSTPERCRGVAEREYDRALGVRRYAALYRDLMDISPGRRITRLAAMVTLPTMASCKGVVSRSMVLSFLEAVQRPFDLHDQTWLGIPAALPAHLIVSALLAGALTWLWRPKAAGILILILILAKEAVDLMIIALYEPLTWAYASGSVADVVASIAGAGLGLWVGTRARRR